MLFPQDDYINCYCYRITTTKLTKRETTRKHTKREMEEELPNIPYTPMRDASYDEVGTSTSSIGNKIK